MESLYPSQRNHNETSERQIASSGDLEETRSQTYCPSFDKESFKVSGSSGLRDNKGPNYIMAHHNQEVWPKICAKLKPIAEPLSQRTSKALDAKTETFIEAISLFARDEHIQKQLRKKKGYPPAVQLKHFFNNLTPAERASYQEKVIPGIAKLILDTEKIFPDGKTFFILRQGSKQKVELSKKQCACLLAHMTMCITCYQGNHKLAKLIDFSALYGILMDNLKLKCIFIYFERFFDENPERKVVFERSILEGYRSEKEWENCEEILTKAKITTQGNIEDNREALQVIFSDKNLGGHTFTLVASTGHQQTMSFNYPELLLSILFCEELQKEEAIRVYGARKFSNYKGYGDSLKQVGPYEEKNIIERELVVMDAKAYNINQAASQFNEKCVVRELNKAYAGFQTENENRREVATGKWGCGNFQGNPQLKFMIQWLAASKAKRDMVFYTYDDSDNFRDSDIEKILKHYQGKTVEDLFKDLVKAMLEMQFVDDYDAVNKNLFQVLITQLGL